MIPRYKRDNKANTITGNKMQSPPDYAPPKPSLVCGSCQVKGADSDQLYSVDLDAMTCDCQYGEPWYLPSKGKTWKPRNLCNHKLKAIASLCSQHPKNTDLRDYYDTQLGKRYNAFEVVSAFHKELRRGDETAALYWATMLIPHRGMHGVVKYMVNILFEETRDISLARYILRVSSKGRSVSLLEMQRAVKRFTHAPKKWHLKWRLPLFIDEQRGYKKLADKFGYEVAKAKDIIPAKHHPELLNALLAGFENADRAKVQYGIKGWFKSQSTDHDHMKIDMLNQLVDVMNGVVPNAFNYDEDYAHSLYELILRRANIHGGVGYHELNALCDALTGEPGNDMAASLPAVKHKAIVNHPKLHRVKLGAMKRIPLYAHDNHTWGGKAKMRQHPNQLEPGANQRDLDFRMCGAYMGVAWRQLAINQHATIDCKWGDVKWTPKWLWPHLDAMWYVFALCLVFPAFFGGA